MRCPICATRTRVTQTMTWKGGLVRRRRRECEGSQHRVTSWETYLSATQLTIALARAKGEAMQEDEPEE
jgi:transcriptional regulator NrdR family protein